MAGKYDAQTRYKKANVLKVTVDFNRNTEGDLVQRIEAQESKAGYIKGLIREDVERHGQTDTAPPEKE